jgi:HTH-type transcriptional regulator / antitoxin HipB
MRKNNTNPAPLAASIQSASELGAYLRAVRLEAGLTHKEAAGFCNVGPRFLLELEHGKATASLGKVFQVLKAYGIRCSAVRRPTGDAR